MALGGYTKLSSSLIASTVWREPDHVRLVWITMLALANADGVVEASLPGLADLARVPVPAAAEAVARLSEPDPYSRTPDHDGRRIEPVAGGWLLLNYSAYRAKQSKEDRREYLRQAKARSRARSTPTVDGQQSQLTVNDVNTSRGISTDHKDLPRSRESRSRSRSAFSTKKPDAVDTASAGDARRKVERRKTHSGHTSGFCDWICLPKRLRDQFAATSGEDISTPELRAAVEARVERWAQAIRGRWYGRQIGDSCWDFWTSRWRERVGSTKTAPAPARALPAVEDTADDVIAEQIRVARRRQELLAEGLTPAEVSAALEREADAAKETA